MAVLVRTGSCPLSYLLYAAVTLAALGIGCSREPTLESISVSPKVTDFELLETLVNGKRVAENFAMEVGSTVRVQISVKPLPGAVIGKGPTVRLAQPHTSGATVAVQSSNLKVVSESPEKIVLVTEFRIPEASGEAFLQFVTSSQPIAEIRCKFIDNEK